MALPETGSRLQTKCRLSKEHVGLWAPVKTLKKLSADMFMYFFIIILVSENFSSMVIVLQLLAYRVFF